MNEGVLLARQGDGRIYAISFPALAAFRSEYVEDGVTPGGAILQLEEKANEIWVCAWNGSARYRVVRFANNAYHGQRLSAVIDGKRVA